MFSYRFLILVSFYLSLLMLAACVTERQVIGEIPKPKDANARADNSAQRAISYMDIEQYETAEKLLKNSLQEVPKHSLSNYIFALLKLRLGEPKKAEKYFKIAVTSDETNSAAAHDYGYYLCQKNKYAQALEMFDLAISNPLFQNKGLSYLRAGECIFNKDQKRAEQYLLASYKEDERLSTSLFRLSELYFLQKNALKARAYYQRYASVQPVSAASLYLAYRVERLAGTKLESDRYRDQLLKKYPGSKEATQVRIKRK